jgi:hypothetical protein
MNNISFKYLIFYSCIHILRCRSLKNKTGNKAKETNTAVAILDFIPSYMKMKYHMA